MTDPKSQIPNPKPTAHNQQNTTYNRKSYISLAEKKTKNKLTSNN